MRKRAFTLVEIMIVVLIIGILLAIAVPQFMRARVSTQQNVIAQSLDRIDHAKQTWAMDNGMETTDTPTEAELVPRYLREWPESPVNGTYVINAVGEPAEHVP